MVDEPISSQKGAESVAAVPIVEVVDNRGCRFYITHEDDPPMINLFRPLWGADLWVGWVKCQIDAPSTLWIADLSLLDRPALSRKGAGKLVPRWVWWKWRKEPYMRRGLGTVLLKETIALARAKGMKYIRGFVVEDDYRKNPNLLKWYHRYGFTVLPCEAGQHKVADIYLEL